MYMDKENIFSWKQAVTATALSTDIVDLGKGDAGPSENISLYVGVDGYGGTGSMVVQLLTSDALNTAGDALDSAVTLATWPVTTAAITAGGKVMADRLPHGMKRYARLNYAVTGTLTGGTLDAGLVWDVQANNTTIMP